MHRARKYICMRVHVYQYNIHICEMLTLILSTHIQDYRVLNLTSSTLICISFSIVRILILKNIPIELEYSIITHLLFLLQYTVLYYYYYCTIINIKLRFVKFFFFWYMCSQFYNFLRLYSIYSVWAYCPYI